MINQYLRDFETNLEYHFSETLEYPIAKPYWIYISLSHRCTYNCQMCGVVKILKGHELSTAVLKWAIDEIAGWKSECVVLFTGGEVFLRKDAFELIGYSVDCGLKTEAVSNGSLINEEFASKIVASGLQNIAVSLDGATEQTHDSIREKGAFKKALDAIAHLVSAKRKLGKGPQVSVWTTIMKENVEELSDIIPLVKELGVECLVYHPVIVAQDDMQNTSPDAPFWVRKERLDILKSQIDRILEYKSKHGLVALLHDPYLWLRYFDAALSKRDWKCNPFVFLNIGPDGEVRSCGESFGNINQMSLGACLESEEAFRARKLMKSCAKPCLQTCWAHPESDSIAEITDKFVQGIKNNKNKIRILESGLTTLERYKKIALTCKNE